MSGIMPDSDSEDEMPPGWEERATIDGSVYYVNHGTKCTQWTHPRTGRKKIVSGDLPLNWERRVSEDGKVFYVDHTCLTTTYSDPRLAFAIEEKDHATDFRQRFDASSTALQVLHGKDLSGRLALITGANVGIGFETARSLALHDCQVIIACRNEKLGQEAVDKIIKERPQAKISFRQLDLASLKNVKEFAKRCRTELRRIDILILNAGVFGQGHTLTEDGYELTFQVNHLGHMYLTLLLGPLCGIGTRIIVVSSESHRFANLPSNPEDWTPAILSPRTPGQYWAMMAYNNSKLCNVLFAAELARRWHPRGIYVHVLHPGNMVSSRLSRSWWIYRIAFAVVRPFTKSLQQAASTTVFVASAIELEGATGIYWNNCWICEPSVASRNVILARKLWELSIEMIESSLGKDALIKENIN